MPKPPAPGARADRSRQFPRESRRDVGVIVLENGFSLDRRDELRDRYDTFHDEGHDEHRREHGCFQPLSTGVQALQRQVKAAFDPGHRFNPGRIYKDL